MYKSVFIRFLKGFIAGGIAQLITLFSAGVVINSVSELKTFGSAVLSAFIVGGLLAVQKAISWQA